MIVSDALDEKLQDMVEKVAAVSRGEEGSYPTRTHSQTDRQTDKGAHGTGMFTYGCVWCVWC